MHMALNYVRAAYPIGTGMLHYKRVKMIDNILVIISYLRFKRSK